MDELNAIERAELNQLSLQVKKIAGEIKNLKTNHAKNTFDYLYRQTDKKARKK